MGARGRGRRLRRRRRRAPTDAQVGWAPRIGEAAALAAARRVMPLPTARERRLAIRLRAARARRPPRGHRRGRSRGRGRPRGLRRPPGGPRPHRRHVSADEARAAGLDPLTFRSIALDTGAGANLLAVAPLPPTFSYSSLDTYENCPLQYAFKYVYRMPQPDRPGGALTFGSTAHAAFEAFTKERRDRAARGEPAPTREDLERLFRRRWVPTGLRRQGHRGRPSGARWTTCWTTSGPARSRAGRGRRGGAAFTLVLDPGDGSAPVRVYGEIDRIDRLPGGGIEVIDYKTGKVSSQKGVARACSSPSTRSPAGMRWAWAPRRR